MLLQRLDGLVGQGILAERTDSQCLESKLSGMVSEVGRCATQFLSFGKHIPQCLAESYYITFLFHIHRFILDFSV